MLRNLLRQLSPFIVLAAVLIIFSFGIVILFYALLASFIISLVIFAINWLQNRFTNHKPKSTKTKQKQGRVIDSDDWRRL